MVTPRRPSFAQMTHFLRELGFTEHRVFEGSTVCRRPGEEALVLLKNRSPDEPVREVDYLVARKYLTEGGFVTDEAFARFAAEAAATAGQPV